MVERLAYDPWGKRRFVSGLPDAFGNIVPLTTDRGFTMHEHLDEMGLIHMNGRVYDPYVGRFLSADPYIQDASNLQSFNRYSYVLNNPLTLTDPSGYWSLKKLWKKIKNVVKAVVIGVVMFYAMPMIIAASGSVFGAGTVAAKLAAGAAGGFLNGALSTGNLKGAFKGALTGMLFAGAGAVGAATGDGGVAHYAAHAGAGCVSAVAQGGKCGQGALSAVVGKFATINLSDGGDGPSLQNFAATSVAGGLASVAGGGKFGDGAATAAQGYLNNQLITKTWETVFKGSLTGSGEKNYLAGQKKAVDGAVATADAVATGISACGAFVAYCRAADTVLSFEKALIEMYAQKDGTAMVGALAGEGANNIQSATIKWANTQVIPANRFSPAFIAGGSYVTGKIVEFQVVDNLKRNK